MVSLSISTPQRQTLFRSKAREIQNNCALANDLAYFPAMYSVAATQRTAAMVTAQILYLTL
jgi:hypothetical protein